MHHFPSYERGGNPNARRFMHKTAPGCMAITGRNCEPCAYMPYSTS